MKINVTPAQTDETAYAAAIKAEFKKAIKNKRKMVQVGKHLASLYRTRCGIKGTTEVMELEVSPECFTLVQEMAKASGEIADEIIGGIFLNLLTRIEVQS